MPAAKQAPVVQANPVLDEIGRLCRERQTGSLVLAAGTGERIEIFFREGMIDAVSSGGEGRRLGDYLVRVSGFAERDLDRIETDARKQAISFGEAALRRRLVGRSALGAAVRSQAIDLLERALDDDFRVESFVNSLRSYPVPAGVEFPRVLLESARKSSLMFDPPPGVGMVLSEDADLTVFPWRPQELCVLAELQSQRTFAALAEATGLEEAVLERILAVLHRLGVIGLEPERGPAAEELAVAPSVRGALAAPGGFPFEDLIPVVTNRALDEKLLAARDSGSFTSEQFKNLKVHLAQAGADTRLQVLTVSSPGMKDGKSFVSANLAFSFAMDPGRRTIIVDCDLRSPSLDRYLGVESEPGLIEYLAGGRLSPYCYVRRIESLYFLTAGGIAENPIEVLSMRRMRELIDRLRVDFDTIILDAPPYSPIADARVVTQLSDGLIMVVRRGQTAYGSADRAFGAIDRNRLLGVVFNDVRRMLFHTYEDFGYYRYGRDPRASARKGHVGAGRTPAGYLEP